MAGVACVLVMRAGSGLRLLLVTVLWSAGCASSAVTPVAKGPAVGTDATLGPGDTFEVSVYGQPDLTGKYRIAEDGSIDFPLVGHVPVAGKGPAEIADLLRTALLEKQILRQPNVSVFLLEQKSKQVSVMGAVVRPGGLLLAPGMTIIQAISGAGGLTGLAAGNDTIVTRQVDGELRRYKVPVERITEGRADNFELRAGDIVFVPERIF